MDVASTESPLFTRESLAKYFDVCPKTIDDRVRDGRMVPPTKVGRRLYWRAEEIAAWLESGAPNRRRWEEMKRDRRNFGERSDPRG